MTGEGFEFELWSSSFCGACRQTRGVLDQVVRLLPAVSITERAVADDPNLAEQQGIEHTPTVILRDAAGAEVFRARGVPNANQALTAIAHALPADAPER
jgi:thiol-disulfide isomerase/thioredoxin